MRLALITLGSPRVAMAAPRGAGGMTTRRQNHRQRRRARRSTPRAPADGGHKADRALDPDLTSSSTLTTSRGSFTSPSTRKAPRRRPRCVACSRQASTTTRSSIARPGFVIQGGDPTAGRGGPGYKTVIRLRPMRSTPAAWWRWRRRRRGARHGGQPVLHRHGRGHRVTGGVRSRRERDSGVDVVDRIGKLGDGHRAADRARRRRTATVLEADGRRRGRPRRGRSIALRRAETGAPPPRGTSPGPAGSSTTSSWSRGLRLDDLEGRGAGGHWARAGLPRGLRRSPATRPSLPLRRWRGGRGSTWARPAVVARVPPVLARCRGGVARLDAAGQALAARSVDVLGDPGSPARPVELVTRAVPGEGYPRPRGAFRCSVAVRRPSAVRPSWRRSTAGSPPARCASPGEADPQIRFLS